MVLLRLPKLLAVFIMVRIEQAIDWIIEGVIICYLQK
jgi:hypothetical protein